MGEVQSTVLALLRERGSMTANEIGERLWGGSRLWEKGRYARPAGRLLRRMERKGLVEAGGRRPEVGGQGEPVRWRIAERRPEPDLFGGKHEPV